MIFLGIPLETVGDCKGAAFERNWKEAVNSQPGVKLKPTESSLVVLSLLAALFCKLFDSFVVTCSLVGFWFNENISFPSFSEEVKTFPLS